MAKYETVLEETAEMLARKQLGLDPKKKDVEKDKDLPQMLVSVKKTFLETLQNSFKKVCATVQEKSGVKDLSDDTMLLIANKINEEAGHGNLESINDLSKNTQIVTVAEKAVIKQVEYDANVASMEGEGASQTIQPAEAIIGIAAIKAMSDQELEEMHNRAQAQYYSEEAQKDRDENKNNDLDAIGLEVNIEEKDRKTHDFVAKEFLRDDLGKIEAIKSGDTKALASSIRRSNLYALTTGDSIDVVKANLMEKYKAILKPEDMRKFAEKIDGIEDSEAFRKALLEFENDHREKAGIRRFDVDKEYEKLSNLRFSEVYKGRIQEDAALTREQREEQRRLKEQLRETRKKVYESLRGERDLSLGEMQQSIEFIRSNDTQTSYKAMMTTLGKNAVEKADMDLIGLHQSFTERDREEARESEAKGPVLSEVRVVRTAPEVKTMDEDDDMIR